MLPQAIFFVVFVLAEQITVGFSMPSIPQYGDDWVLFQDPRGLLRYVNMTYSDDSQRKKPEGRKVHFQLYTRNNPQEYEEIYPDPDKPPRNYQSAAPLKMVAHGWISSGSAPVAIDTKNAYLNRSDVNVVVVDWSELADEPTYFVAAYLTQYVGEKVAEMAQSLMSRYTFAGDNVHLIGHSLGAHVMGYAGSCLKKRSGPVAKLTGLDPARPFFEQPPTGGISPEDANFVSIIHTNAGYLGVKEPRGHADFYPNGGAEQPGCGNGIEFFDACAHSRAYEYFAESILSGGFSGRQCQDYSAYEEGKCASNQQEHMGEHVDTDARGTYYLDTNAESRYSKDES